MNCPKCNRIIPDDAVLCCYCGKRFFIDRKAPKRGNGQGTAFKRGKYWYAQITTGMKPYAVLDLKNPPPEAKKPKQAIRKTKGGFRTKAEALAYCETLRKTKDRIEISLENLWKQWEPWYSPRIDPSTMNGYRAAYNYFSPIHKDLMSTIRAADLQDCMDKCDKGKRTHQNMKVVSGLLWSYAVDKDYIDKDITRNLYTGKGKSVKREPLTEAEVEAIKKAIGTERYAEYIYCLCYLGYRPGEMLELRKEQVTEKDGRLFLAEGKKTDAGRDRIIPVHKSIEDIIRSRMFVPGTCLVFPQYIFTRGKKSTFCGFKQFSDSHFREGVFKRIMSRLGIAEGKVPYGARHTFSNKLKKAEGDGIDKAALMGHSDYTFTQTHYQSTDTDELTAVIDSMK